MLACFTSLEEDPGQTHIWLLALLHRNRKKNIDEIKYSVTRETLSERKQGLINPMENQSLPL